MAKLKLIRIENVGSDNERVVMRATEDLDLGDYIVTDTTYSAAGTTTSNKLRHVYEFDPKQVEKGDAVVLCSRVGQNKTGKSTDTPPVPVHWFFWNLKERIWNRTGDRAFLLYSPRKERQSVSVPAVDKVVK